MFEKLSNYIGNFNLFKNSNNVEYKLENKKDIVDKIEDDWKDRTKKTIRKWRDALERAEHPTQPNRKYLFDIYEDVLYDNTLIGAIEQRIEKILSTDWEVKINGEISNQYDYLFKDEVFYKIIKYISKSFLYNHSILEIDGINTDNKITDVKVIPRKNIYRRHNKIKLSESKSINYKNENINKFLLDYIHDEEDEYDLGLLSKIAPLVLYKKEALKSWNRFSEVFGMPMRIARTDSANYEDRAKLKKMLENMSSNMTAVLDKEIDIEFKENSNSDANKVFEQLISLLNKEIYKAVLGQTMSSEDSASYSQAYIHNKMFNYKTQNDLRNIEFFINNQVIPKFKNLNLINPEVPCSFSFVDREQITMKERIDIDRIIMSEYTVDKNYIENKYEVPIIDYKQQNTGFQARSETKKDDEQNPDVQNRVDKK